MQIFGTPSNACEPKYVSNSAVFWHYSRVCWRLAPHQIYRREKAYCSKSTEGKLHKCNYKFFNGMNQCEFVCCLAAVLFCFVISCCSVYWHGMACRCHCTSIYFQCNVFYVPSRCFYSSSSSFSFISISFMYDTVGRTMGSVYWIHCIRAICVWNKNALERHRLHWILNNIQRCSNVWLHSFHFAWSLSFSLFVSLAHSLSFCNLAALTCAAAFVAYVIARTLADRSLPANPNFEYVA